MPSHSSQPSLMVSHSSQPSPMPFQRAQASDFGSFSLAALLAHCSWQLSCWLRLGMARAMAGYVPFFSSAALLAELQDYDARVVAIH
jgi:hypothetical protein